MPPAGRKRLVAAPTRSPSPAARSSPLARASPTNDNTQPTVPNNLVGLKKHQIT